MVDWLNFSGPAVTISVGIIGRTSCAQHIFHLFGKFLVIINNKLEEILVNLKRKL